MIQAIVNQKTLLIITIFASVKIQGMQNVSQEAPNPYIKDILFNATPDQKEKFTAALIRRPDLIATDTHDATEFSNAQALAHWIVNQMNLELLNVMYNLNETASTPITRCYDNNHPNQLNAIGSTPFLTLCFKIRDVKPEQKESYLSLLNNFAARTPAVIIKSRKDGMTPAMAIAASNSPLKPEALRILRVHHPHAFAGCTVKKISLLQIALKSPTSPQSIEAIRCILDTKKQSLVLNKNY